MNREIAIIGLGYVGLSLATALSKTYKVYGYDISESRIQELKKVLTKTIWSMRQSCKTVQFFYQQYA